MQQRSTEGIGAERAFREWCRPEVWQQGVVSQPCFLHHSLEEHDGALVQGPKMKNTDPCLAKFAA